MSMSLLLGMALAVPQSTWIVDRSAGPGAHFLDVDAAVAAANSGDTILLRPSRNGGYLLTSVSGKALRIRNEDPPTAAQAVRAGLTVLQTIFAVPAGSVFTFEGLDIYQMVFDGGSLELINCSVTEARIRNAALAASRCAFFGGPNYSAMTVDANSILVANRCTFRGSQQPAGSCPSRGWASGGLEATDSACYLHSCSAFGGSDESRDFFCNPTRTSLPAIFLTRSSLRLVGEATDVVAAGPSHAYGTFQYPPPSPAIRADAASVAVLHGGIQLRVALGWSVPLVEGPVTMGAAPLPSLDVTGTEAPSGQLAATQPVTVSVQSSLPNAPMLLAFSDSPTAPIDFAPIALGEVMLPLATFFLPAVLDGSGAFQVTFPGTLIPWLGGRVFGQAAVLDVTGGQVRMSNLELRPVGF